MDAHPGLTGFDPLAELTDLEAADSFVARHIAPSADDLTAMLAVVGAVTYWAARKAAA